MSSLVMKLPMFPKGRPGCENVGSYVGRTKNSVGKRLVFQIFFYFYFFTDRPIQLFIVEDTQNTEFNWCRLRQKFLFSPGYVNFI